MFSSFQYALEACNICNVRQALRSHKLLYLLAETFEKVIEMSILEKKNKNHHPTDCCTYLHLFFFFFSSFKCHYWHKAPLLQVGGIWYCNFSGRWKKSI